MEAYVAIEIGWSESASIRNLSKYFKELGQQTVELSQEQVPVRGNSKCKGPQVEA